MTDPDPTTQQVRDALRAHGLTPREDEIATLAMLAPLLRMGADHLYVAEIGAEL